MDTQVSELLRVPVTRRDTHRALAAALLIILVIGAIGRFAGADRVGAVGLLIFVLMGPGAALVSFTRLPGGLAGRLCIAFGLSVTVLTGLSLIELYLDTWAPTATLLVVVILAAVALLAASFLPSRETGGRHAEATADGTDEAGEPLTEPVARPVDEAIVETDGLEDEPRDDASAGAVIGRRRAWLVAQVVAVVLCVVGALISQTGNPPIGGFLRTVNPIWYVGIVVLVIAASVAFFGKNESALGRSGPASAALLLCSTVAITPVLIYGTPRSQSAEKHVQLSELIARTHELKASQTIYNDWPGLFSASAWLKDFCGIGDLVSLATWWPVILVLFRVLAMRLLAGVFVKSDRMAWLATTIVFFATPGGIDYYSPQAIGYTVGLTILWIGVSRAFTLRTQCVLVFLLSCGVVVTHQLTPYIVGGALVVLAVFRQLSRWWIPALVLVPTLVWTGIHFDQVKHFVSPSTVGSTGNFTLPSQRATSHPGLLVHGAIALTAVAIAIVGLLALATLVRNLKSLQTWGVAVASLVGFVAVFINAYGNEGTFRAVFFAIPWFTILAISSISALYLWRPRLQLIPRTVVALIAVLVPISLVGTYALDGSTTIRRGDRDFLLRLRNQALANPDRSIAIVSLGNADFPAVSASTVKNFKLYRGTITSLVRTNPPSSPGFATELGRQVAPLVSGKTDTTLYAFSSPAVNAYQDEYGQVTLQQSRQIREAMENSPVWTRTYDRRGTEGFRLNLAALGG